MTFLFVVDLSFNIKGRGCVLAPGLSTESDAPKVGRGARIRLETPSGADIETEIKGLEMLKYLKPPVRRTVPILLPRNLTKEDVPPGTSVYLISEGSFDDAQQ